MVAQNVTGWRALCGYSGRPIRVEQIDPLPTYLYPGLLACEEYTDKSTDTSVPPFDVEAAQAMFEPLGDSSAICVDSAHGRHWAEFANVLGTAVREANPLYCS